MDANTSVYDCSETKALLSALETELKGAHAVVELAHLAQQVLTQREQLVVCLDVDGVRVGQRARVAVLLEALLGCSELLVLALRRRERGGWGTGGAPRAGAPGRP